MADFPHVQLAEQYVDDVLAGRIEACQWVRLACRRHRDDMARVADESWLYRFDEDKAEDICFFISNLPHTKGKWAKKDRLNPRAHLIHLEPWQCFILCSIFGWVGKADNLRRFTTASIYVPRKNGKSIFAAGIGWYMFAYDGEPGAEVYSGATTEKQAWEVFGPARQMAIKLPAVASTKGVTVNAASLVIEGDGAKFEPVIGKPGDGASPHCAIVDEYHEHPTSALLDTMTTGMGAREQPLALIISTAGSLHAGPCRDDWLTCEKILQRMFTDETHFAIIFTLDRDDEWQTEAGLRKANPNWGVSVITKTLLGKLDVAKQDPKQQATFKTKHCNLWVTSKAGYYNVQKWKDLGQPGLKVDEFKGKPVFLMSDFAAKTDLTVTTYLFPEDGDNWAVFCKCYLPEETVNLPQNQHYRKWAAEGWLTVTEGAMTDMRQVQDDVIEACSLFSVRVWLFDPNRVYGVVQPLQEAGVPVVSLLTSAAIMSKPMRKIDDLIKAGRIRHDGNPIMTWAISNVIGHGNRKEQVYPGKERPENKIDPAVTLIGAMSQAMVDEAAPTPGVSFL